MLGLNTISQTEQFAFGKGTKYDQEPKIEIEMEF